jgi:hypothetical protein
MAISECQLDYSFLSTSPLLLSSLRHFTNPEFILAGEGSIKERGLRPLSKFLPLFTYGAFKRGVSPSSFSSPSPDRRGGYRG